VDTWLLLFGRADTPTRDISATLLLGENERHLHSQVISRCWNFLIFLNFLNGKYKFIQRLEHLIFLSIFSKFEGLEH
jgi:hypothetical protein